MWNPMRNLESMRHGVTHSHNVLLLKIIKDAMCPGHKLRVGER